jgi:endonuclease YncB( thermonuclease family)
MKNIFIAFVACLACSLAQAADLSGVPRIVDGDTLAIGATKVRLEGIDAPETDQVCLDANGVRWTCGIDARDQLAAHIAAQEIDCTSHGTDAYRRTLATCYLAGEDFKRLDGSAGLGARLCEVLVCIPTGRRRCASEPAGHRAGRLHCAVGLAASE